MGQRTTPTTIRGGNPKRFRAVAAWRELRGLPKRKLAEYPLWCFNDDVAPLFPVHLLTIGIPNNVVKVKGTGCFGPTVNPRFQARALVLRLQRKKK